MNSRPAQLVDSAARERFAGIELGGTKVICVLAEGDAIVDQVTIATSTPGETLSAAQRCILGWQADGVFAGLGIASFGPIRLNPHASDYGQILATPKLGWSGAPVLATLASGVDAPCVIDTDVNAAALAEHRWGGGRDCSSFIYLTIGTGIGGGWLVNGLPVHGRLHPEVGHIPVRRAFGDSFAGICPFHGDCIEGLVSGPALAARFGKAPESVGAEASAWGHAAHDLAQLLVTLIHAAAPQRILVGGGVGLSAPHLLRRAIEMLPGLLGGYYPDLTAEALAGMVVPAMLGEQAGPKGAIRLAQLAYARALDTRQSPTRAAWQHQ